MPKYLVVCDYADKFPNYFKDENIYNDHYKKENLHKIVETINSLGYKCEYYGGVDDLIKAVHDKTAYDKVVFLNFNDGLTQLHKRGQTPILLEMLTDSFSGPDAFAALLADDKYGAGSVVKTLDCVKVPNHILYKYNDPCNSHAISQLAFPVIAKPNNEGSSIGIDQSSFCENIDDLQNYINKHRGTFDNILLEEYIQGFEFTVFLIGNNEEFIINQPLAIGLQGKYWLEKEIFDAQCKRAKARCYCAPEMLLSTCDINKLKNAAAQIFKVLRLRDLARIDFRYRNGDIYFIEANTVPAIGEHSDAGQVCKIREMEFADFIKAIIHAVNKRLHINNALD